MPIRLGAAMFAAAAALALGSAALVASGCGAGKRAAFIPAEDAYDVRILRDTWGVPHIFGKTDADAAYGLGFAHAEDDWVYMQEAFLVARGQLASLKGRDSAVLDYFVHLFRVREFVEEKYARELSPDVRAVIEAYAAGVTHFAALNPRKFNHIELPITGKDVVAGSTLKSPFFYELHTVLQRLFAGDEEVPVSTQGVLAFEQGLAENPLGGAGTIGSNTWAIAPSRSADGATRLAINSHMPWTGQVTWYEAHLISEEGWNVIGGTFPGGPMIFKGHDGFKGWCHTINRPDLADVYELTINPDNPNQYRFDGEWRDFERRMAPIRVKLWGPISWTFKRECLWSVHGPALRTPEGVFALRFAGYGEVRQLEQWYRMNKARSFEEFKEAMEANDLVSLNTLYADRDGNLLYVYGGQFPDRPEGFDWRGILPGDTSAALTGDPLPYSALPRIENPVSGFLQSCNNAPFYTTDGPDNPRPEDFPESMGIETYMTNRAWRALELYGADPAITREAFFAYKYDKNYSERSWAAAYQRDLAAAPLSDYPELAEAAERVLSWSRDGERGNMTTALALLAAEPYHKRQRAGYDPDPIAHLREAAGAMMKHHGTLEVRWEDMLRLRRGDLDLGLGGGPDCLRAIDIALESDGRFVGVNGDCYFLMVEWDAEGNMRSEGIHQFGAATVDANSPHFADQAPLFAAEKTRPTFFTEEEIRANLAREYRPGALNGPWYEN